MKKTSHTPPNTPLFSPTEPRRKGKIIIQWAQKREKNLIKMHNNADVGLKKENF